MFGKPRKSSRLIIRCVNGDSTDRHSNSFIYLCISCVVIKSPNEVWRLIVFAPFLIIILLLLSFFRQKFIQHISRRLLNGNQRNFTGMLSTMSRCADYFWNFQNGHRQNAKKLKNTKIIIVGYSPNRN